MKRTRSPLVRVVGITGRIGSGKSTLARFLADRFGCPVIDADRIGHEAWEAVPRLREAVGRRFGPGVLDATGGIQRARLATIVFDDSQALRDLNAIVHPWMIEEIHRRLAALRAAEPAGIVLIDAALLLDWIDRLPCDRIVFVRCPDEAAVRRLTGRGMEEREVRRRLARQDPEDRFLRLADFVVENDGTERELEEQAARLWETLTADRKEKSQ